MITFVQKGDFRKTDTFFQKMLEVAHLSILDKYGKIGVDALSEATPQETGLASESWFYIIEHKKDGVSIAWCNSDIENGFPVAVMLQYGHGTGTGGYVQGRDYINPAMQPVFDKIAEDAWKEVTSA